jgi:hypothetical protein
MDIYEELYKLYHDFDDKIYGLIKDKNKLIKNKKDKLVYPLFIYPTDEYINADVKIIIFGKETNGWYGIYGSNDDVDVCSIMDNYNDFFGTKYCYTYGGQFWNMIKYLINKIKEDKKEKKIGYLWNNLIKAGIDGKGFPWNWYKEIIEPNFNELIPRELEILKPDFIIFFTGPNSSNGPYDSVLDRIFGKPNRNKIKGFSNNELCEIEIHNVIKSFRTYHPTYLLRNNKKKPYKIYIEKIVEEISKSI